MQKSAVEWLVEQIKSDQNKKALFPNEWMDVIKQAKEMEKQQIEISDEEIEKAADKYVSEDEFNRLLECFEQGAKWYREQLKNKQ